MKRTRFLVVALTALTLVWGFSAPADAGDVDLNLLYGKKQLDDEWEPLEEQTEFGVQVTISQEEWPLGMAVDFLRSTDENSGSPDLEATTTEFAVGVRKIWAGRRTRPFVGGGLALVEVEIDGDAVIGKLKDDGVGGWIDGGVFWRVGRHLNLGLELRMSRAKVDPPAVVLEEGGGNHALVFLGWGSFRQSGRP